MEMNQVESHVPACDVLVIGSGGAGLRAAIAARERGAEVLVLSKSPLGSASCTMYSGGLFTFSVPGGLSFEEHYQNTLATGRGLCDERLAYVLCREGPEAVRELERFDVSFQYLKTGATTGPLGPHLRGGLGIVQGLAGYAKKIGVRAQQDVMVTDLLTDRHGAVVGALGLVDSTGELIICRAKAVVLATGGAGAIYPRTNNPRQIGGDGYSLAYDAGARLMDMEFVQFYPTGLAEPGAPCTTLPLWWMDFFPVTNTRGEEFLRSLMDEQGVKTAQEANFRLRDLTARAIALEIQNGRGLDGAVLMDFRVLPERLEHDPKLRFDVERRLSRLPFLERPLHVAPLAHHCMGGVIVDEFGQTSLPGLFAAGEICAGIHGASRHAGNALTDAIVFGRRAGETAEGWARSEGGAMPQAAEVVATKEELYRWLGEPDRSELTIRELQQAVCSVAGEYLFVMRSAQGLERALAQLSELEQCRIYAGNMKALAKLLQVRNSLNVAKLIAQAALQREESRGAHFRLDFPQQDDFHWRCHIVQEKRNST